jgi:hypothetical protein
MIEEVVKVTDELMAASEILVFWAAKRCSAPPLP